MPDSTVSQEMLETNDELRRLYEEHQDCERRLEALAKNVSLSEERELQAKQIKRHKLFLKDRIQQIVREQQAASTPA